MRGKPPIRVKESCLNKDQCLAGGGADSCYIVKHTKLTNSLRKQTEDTAWLFSAVIWTKVAAWAYSEITGEYLTQARADMTVVMTLT